MGATADGENPNTPPLSVRARDKSRVASKDRFMSDDRRRAVLLRDLVICSHVQGVR
jgi:hypothetical protein